MNVKVKKRRFVLMDKSSFLTLFYIVVQIFESKLTTLNYKLIEVILGDLKQKLELNEITQEEYEIKRAEIINRL